MISIFSPWIKKPPRNNKKSTCESEMNKNNMLLVKTGMTTILHHLPRKGYNDSSDQ